MKINKVLYKPSMAIRKCKLYGMEFEFFAMLEAKFNYATIDSNGDIILRFAEAECYESMGFWYHDEEPGQIIATVEYDGDWHTSQTEIEWL